MNLQNKGFTLTELLGVILIMSIVILLIISNMTNISHSLKENSYENKINLIEIAASNYAYETGNLRTNVDHLIKLGYLNADNDLGDFTDPRKEGNLNCHIVDIREDNSNFYATYNEEEECDINKLLIENANLGIDAFTVSGKIVKDNTWTNENVLLKTYFKGNKKISNQEIKSITWLSTDFKEERMVNNNFPILNEYLVTTNEIKNTTIKVEVTLKDNTLYKAEINIKIDKQKPVIYYDSLKINNQNEIEFSVSDGLGSGIYGYYIDKVNTNEEINCKNVNYIKNSNNTYKMRLLKGKYYVCVKDMVGNTSEDISKHTLTIQ